MIKDWDIGNSRSAVLFLDQILLKYILVDSRGNQLHYSPPANRIYQP